jgi:hypothetical protein
MTTGGKKEKGKRKRSGDEASQQHLGKVWSDKVSIRKL